MVVSEVGGDEHDPELYFTDQRLTTYPRVLRHAQLARRRRKLLDRLRLKRLVAHAADNTVPDGDLARALQAKDRRYRQGCQEADPGEKHRKEEVGGCRSQRVDTRYIRAAIVVIPGGNHKRATVETSLILPAMRNFLGSGAEGYKYSARKAACDSQRGIAPMPSMW